MDGALPRLLRWVTRPDRPSPAFVGLSLLAYAALVFALIAFHEPWRDEADAWLAARDLLPGELRTFTRNAGTPALWYLVLAPLARSGAPYESMLWLHGLIACGVAWLVLRHGPFSRPFKLLLLTSVLFGYEYAVVARNYSLLLLLLFGLAALHPARRRQPLLWGLLVALLANTQAIGAFFAAGIWLARALELRDDPDPRRARIGLVLGAGGGLLALWMLWPAADGQALGGFLRSPLAIAADLSRGFGPALFALVPWTGACAGLAILGLGLRSSAPFRGSAGLPLLVGLTGMLALFTTTLQPSLRHVGLIPSLLLYALWVGAPTTAGARRARRSALAVWALLLLASLPPTVRLWIGSIYAASSGSTEMARYLIDNDLDRGPLALHGSAVAVLPYLRRAQAYSPGIDANGSFQRWDRAWEEGQRLEGEEVLARVRRRFAGRSALLVLARPVPEPERRGLQLLYACQRPLFRNQDERFFLYWVQPR